MRLAPVVWICCVCALLADLSCGDVDGTNDGQVADPLVIVKGAVTDSLNGLALDSVAILKDGLVRGYSQANGQYEVAWFGDVHAWLRFEKPEYAPREVDVAREAIHDSTVEWGYRLDVRMRRL